MIRDASPSFVILNYGTNDIAQNVPSPNTASKLMDIAQGILNSVHSVIRIMILGTIDRNYNAQFFRSEVEEVNAIL